MSTITLASPRERLLAWSTRHATALVPGLVVVALMLVWAEHDGGYNADTWYWGALLMLVLLSATVAALGRERLRLPRTATVALGALGLYVVWSYLSITWAQSPGQALEGSNRALLYLLVFAELAVLPWTIEAALIALGTFVVGVGVIAIVILARLGSAHHVGQLVIQGRLASPTGYFNANAALFTMAALAAIALAALRELPALLRGGLIAIACAALQLAVLSQSRGWLFTLPLIVVVAICLVRDRLHVAAVALIPIAGVLVSRSWLLDVFRAGPGSALDQAASRVGHRGLLICAAALVIGAAIAQAETMGSRRRLSARGRRGLGTAVIALALAGACVGVAAATHGHPGRFVQREWRGFTANSTPRLTGSHFTTVGDARSDFWRVAADAFAAHPIGGLGQDNFADYYVSRGRSGEEPLWTHSLELRLLVHTGIVGFLLFAAFLIAALSAALGGLRRRTPLARAASGAALLPLAVWLFHGSVDWFWEMPALTGPALGFLAIAMALGREQPGMFAVRPRPWGRVPRVISGVVLASAGLAAAVVLGAPYLAVREVSRGGDIQRQDPAAALRDLKLAGELNPLSSDPGRLGGVVALRAGRYAEAEQRFRQAIDREPGGWFPRLGLGLAASMLGDRGLAHKNFAIAASIDVGQIPVERALALVYTRHPLTPRQALKLIVLEN